MAGPLATWLVRPTLSNSRCVMRTLSLLWPSASSCSTTLYGSPKLVKYDAVRVRASAPGRLGSPV